MAIFERPKSMEKIPTDLVAVIRDAGVLTERQLAAIRGKLLKGEYPADPIALAERLVKDNLVTVYQARRFLGGKSHGLVVGRYVILDRIGSGSMGRVYKAHHQMMDRVVALKIIAPEIAANEKVVARFQREMKLVGRLDHPNVVRAFDADQINKILYIVMEYVSGQSLGERLKKGPIPPAEMFDYGSQAAFGLAHAHEQGMVHRDIKPSNMLLTEDRKIKILDLGLGLLLEADNHSTFMTADGIAVGTVDYMSPEQALGRDVDGRSDLFSLGCAMFHLMTGKLAFPGDSPIDRLGRRISSKPASITDYIPEMPTSAVRVLEKLMAAKPGDRYATAVEAAEGPAIGREAAVAASIAATGAVRRFPVPAQLRRGETAGGCRRESPDGPAVDSGREPHARDPDLDRGARSPRQVGHAELSAVVSPRGEAGGEQSPRVIAGLILAAGVVFGAGIAAGYVLR